MQQMPPLCDQPIRQFLQASLVLSNSDLSNSHWSLNIYEKFPLKKDYSSYNHSFKAILNCESSKTHVIHTDKTLPHLSVCSLPYWDVRSKVNESTFLGRKHFILLSSLLFSLRLMQSWPLSFEAFPFWGRLVHLVCFPF